MEKHKRNCRQGGKELQRSMSNYTGGSSVERVVVLGGALAIANLVGKSGNYMERTDLAAIDSCRKEEDGTEGLDFILQEDSSSILHQNSSCTNHGTSNFGVQEIPIHDTEQERIGVTGGNGAIEKISRPVTDHNPMNVVKDESNDSLVMETIAIEIEDGEVDADAEQSTAEEKSTLQQPSLSSVSSLEEKSSFSAREEDAEENSLMQSSFSTEEEDYNEESYSPMPSSFSTVEEEEEEEDDDDGGEEEEEYSRMESPFEEEEEEEEEDSTLQSSTSTEEDEEYLPMRSRLSQEEEENTPSQSSFSTGEEDEEEYSRMQSSFSTEEDEEYSPMRSKEEEEEEEGDVQDANVTETEEESSEGTWNSSPDSAMERIMQAKKMNISLPLSVSKFEEKDAIANKEAHRHYLAKTSDKRACTNGENNKEMNAQMEHSANRQIWVWLGLGLPLLLMLANCLVQHNYLSFSFASVFRMK